MSLADRLAEEAAKPAITNECSIALWLATQPAKDRDAFGMAVEAVGRGDMTRAAVWRACKEFGLSVGVSTLNRHIKGECQCEPR